MKGNLGEPITNSNRASRLLGVSNCMVCKNYILALNAVHRNGNARLKAGSSQIGDSPIL